MRNAVWSPDIFGGGSGSQEMPTERLQTLRAFAWEELGIKDEKEYKRLLRKAEWYRAMYPSWFRKQKREGGDEEEGITDDLKNTLKNEYLQKPERARAGWNTVYQIQQQIKVLTGKTKDMYKIKEYALNLVSPSFEGAEEALNTHRKKIFHFSPDVSQKVVDYFVSQQSA